ncbi:rhodanese-like domain-containing protein [Algoriphagus vanfongensis]|uniref:rhodanese-like domain-containing protein n=1 Tax=Algoriphagus vanfongensis TaxID=426371 RepID=UPI000429A961|nr:rhodanese-like domain-containing protein [Algoriphagus vanfongensis]
MKKSILLFFLLAGLYSCGEPKQQTSQEIDSSQEIAPIQVLTAAEFKSQVDHKAGILIDVRTPGEVAQGKIAGATNLDINSPEFEQEILQLPKNQDIYLYCSAGIRSQKAADLLLKNGYKQVFHLDGGLASWIEAGYLTD